MGEPPDLLAGLVARSPPPMGLSGATPGFGRAVLPQWARTATIGRDAPVPGEHNVRNGYYPNISNSVGDNRFDQLRARYARVSDVIDPYLQPGSPVRGSDNDKAPTVPWTACRSTQAPAIDDDHPIGR